MKYEMYRNSVQEKSHREVVLFLYENLKKGNKRYEYGKIFQSTSSKKKSIGKQ